jgi:hypothetical protein
VIREKSSYLPRLVLLMALVFPVAVPSMLLTFPAAVLFPFPFPALHRQSSRG